ncbi:trypsin-like peptidase domain-containing protein [Streptomyces changanensis]|uniref:Trypsin-like peptidase domain-containing protein n=2 Tax=Streptomyces changanensis TaxID=2964669 RepID=A0ABY5NFN6_9ACTN|nr:trypsin-like peptidase domain-containing protein [Streptomyces changanensis]UUS34820.1 trypsin-like peptidase domain-containing protein [Streptomyces changanensis]
MAGPGVTVWPGGGQPPADGTTPPPAPPGPPAPGPAPRRRRARRPVGLIAAVAIVAAAVGGGAGALAQDLVGGDATGGGSTAVAGTAVSQSDAGTVAGVARAVSPSIVEIRAAGTAGSSTGSGVIITADGEVVTNNHVVSGASEVTVRLSDGRTHTADVVGTDPDKDLALLKLRGAKGLKPAVLGDSGSVRVGEQVVAIGSPEGLTGTVTSGIVSALDRDVTVAKDDDSAGGGQGGQWYDSGQGWPFEFGGQRFNGDTGASKTTYKAIQTDASLNPGNSGGALINMRGEVIGINSAMYAPSATGGAGMGAAGSVGLGFAIPVDTVKADLDALRGGG